MFKKNNYVVNNKIKLNLYYLKITLYYLLILIIFFLLLSIAFSYHIKANNKIPHIHYPPVKFAVLSDTHVFDNNSNPYNPVYLKYGIDDKKLLNMSGEILKIAIDKIIQEDNIDFVVVTGDLTDIGDNKSHQFVANRLQKLIDNNIKVFVIPGNHDGFKIDNNEFKNIPADIISPTDFSNIYMNFGYKDAIYKDNHSLSYVVEPIDGLWLLMIDSCIYNNNDSYHVINGKIKEDTLNWIIYILEKAVKKKKAVIGCLHHGILKHYNGQQQFFEEYLVDDWEIIAPKLAFNNLNIVFTGHNHALDIAYKEFNNIDTSTFSYLYDIETSSIISYPNGFRIVEIKNDQILYIESKYIKEIETFENGFREYTRKYVKSRIKEMSFDKLKKYHVNNTDNDRISTFVAESMVIHYKGNEQPKKNLKIEGLNIWSKFIYSFYQDLLDGLWNNPKPDDLNIKIDLRTGYWHSLD